MDGICSCRAYLPTPNEFAYGRFYLSSLIIRRLKNKFQLGLDHLVITTAISCASAKTLILNTLTVKTQSGDRKKLIVEFQNIGWFVHFLNGGHGHFPPPHQTNMIVTLSRFTTIVVFLIQPDRVRFETVADGRKSLCF